MGQYQIELSIIRIDGFTLILYQGWDPRSGPRRNSKDSDFLSVRFKIDHKNCQNWPQWSKRTKICPKTQSAAQVLANPVNIRRSSAPPVQTRQRSLSSIKVPIVAPPQKISPPQNQTSSKTNFFLQLRPEDDDESDHNLTPILERKSGRQPFTKKDTVLQLELQFENEMRKSHYHWELLCAGPKKQLVKNVKQTSQLESYKNPVGRSQLLGRVAGEATLGSRLMWSVFEGWHFLGVLFSRSEVLLNEGGGRTQN